MRSASENSSRGARRLSGSPSMDYLPVFLRVSGQAALVVGGGQVALRKVEWLLKAGAHVTVVAPQRCAELRARAAAGEFLCLPGVFEPAQLAAVALAIAATGDTEVNAAVARAAGERRIPVNVVDQPDLSSFIFPAIIDRSPIVIAVSSAGHAPVLARRLREQIEALLPARLGALARFMGTRRPAVHRALGRLARRPFWERIVSGRTATRLLAGDEAAAERAFRGELRTSQRSSCASGGGTPGGGVSDRRGSRRSGPADAARPATAAAGGCDPLRPAGTDAVILERARRDAERIFVGKEPGRPSARRSASTS